MRRHGQGLTQYIRYASNGEPLIHPQWAEMLEDPEQKIARPRQVYLGQDTRHYVPLLERKS